jgi:hypothetical protein
MYKINIFNDNTKTEEGFVENSRFSEGNIENTYFENS